MRPSHVVALTLIALGLLPASLAVAARGTAVLEPARAEDPRVFVRVDGARYCLTLTDGAGEVERGNGEECDEVQSRELDDPWLRMRTPDTFGEEGHQVAAGAVDAATTTVRLRLRGSVVLDIVTRALEQLPAPFTQMRFFAAALPPGAEVTAIELLGIDGAPRGETLAAAPSGLGWFIGSFAWLGDQRVVRVARPARLADGWQPRVYVAEQSAPLPGAPVHRRRIVCVDVPAARFGDSACAQPTTAAYQLALSEQCAAGGRRFMVGLVPSRLRRVRMELADGRLVPAREMALGGFGAPALKAYAAAAPVAVGVRAIWYDTPGSGSRRDVVSIAPWSTACDGGVSFATTEDEPLEPLGHQTTLEPSDAPSLHLAETSDRLCLALGRAPEPRDCGTPRAGIGATLQAESAVGVAVSLDPRVTDARVQLSDGRWASAAVLAPPTNAGPLASRLRFVVVRGRPGRRPIALQGRDRTGRRVATVEFDAARPLMRGRTLLRIGRWRLREDLMRNLTSGERVACGTLVRPGTDPAPRCDGWGFDRDVVDVSSRCDLGRVILMGGVSAEVRAVTVRARGGATVPVRRLRRLAAGQRGWVSVVPRGVTVTAVEHRRRDGIRLVARHTIPPASRQCGYDGWMPLRQR